MNSKQQYWQLTWELPKLVLSQAECLLEEHVLSISSFEQDEAADRWCLTCLLEEKPVPSELKRWQASLAEQGYGELPSPSLAPLSQRDWVSENQRQFPIIETGPFTIYGTHHEQPLNAVSTGHTMLLMDAGAAFGTGTHATTNSCLQALFRVMRYHRPHQALDMGCGSGILSIALARRWHIPTLAVDMDPDAVRVAQQNIHRNHVESWVKVIQADHYRDHRITAQSYDLVMSNLFARPLMRFAPYLGKALAPGGIAILSGLMKGQERRILTAHIMQGMHLVNIIRQEGWVTLILKKGK